VLDYENEGHHDEVLLGLCIDFVGIPTAVGASAGGSSARRRAVELGGSPTVSKQLIDDPKKQTQTAY